MPKAGQLLVQKELRVRVNGEVLFFLLVSEIIICDQHMCLNSPVSMVIGIDRDQIKQVLLIQ